MKPFTDPFPFRNPETRSSIGEVIAKITNTEVVEEGKKGVGAYTVIKKRKTVQKGSAADSTPDTTTTEYDVTKRGVKVGDAKRDNYFGQTSGTVHGKSFSGTGSAQTDLHRFLKSKRGATVREEVVQESHTRAQLEKMTTTQLRVLLKKYTALVAGGAMTAAAELANIRGLLRAKGAGVVLDEAVMGKKKWKSVVSNWKKPQDSTSARLDAGAEKRGGGRAQDKAADAVAVRLGGKTKP